jgi:hypothetical protein
MSLPQGRTTHHARSAGIPPSIAPRRRLACAGAASCFGARSRREINQAIASFASDPWKRENRLRKLREVRKSMPAVRASLLPLVAGESLPQEVAGYRWLRIRLRELRKSLHEVQAPLLRLAGESLPQGVAGQQNYICGSSGTHLSRRWRQIRLRELRKSRGDSSGCPS